MTTPIALSLLLLQQAPAQQPGGGSGIGLLIQMGLIVVIFYFLFIRPQQKQRKAHEERIRQIKRGDEIVTAGGIVGEIVHIKEGIKDGAPTPTMEDRITIKSGETRLIVERGRIARIVAPESGESS